MVCAFCSALPLTTHSAPDVKLFLESALVVEVSWGVGNSDVERAARRAALLGQTGVRTMPVVAGQAITDEAAELSQAMQAWQVIDGRLVSPAG